MRPLVSIIIPCHNAALWLAATLESALAQTWPQKEIILVDDGSTDDSLTIARQYEQRGVTVFSQPNRGASAARNAGLRAAHGDFLQFLDADDLLTPGKIGAQIELLSSKPAGTLATCAWGRFHTDPAMARFVDDVVFRDFAPMDFLILAGQTGAMMHPSAWLVPKEVATAAGPWDESLSLNDDGEYFCRIVLAATDLAFCSSVTARSLYRSGLAGSLSQQRSERARRSQFRSVELITAQLLRCQDSPRVRQACAGHWRRFIHDFFPSPPDLIAKAEASVRELGETVGRPSMGPRTAFAAALLGWRNVWRLKYLLRG